MGLQNRGKRGYGKFIRGPPQVIRDSSFSSGDARRSRRPPDPRTREQTEPGDDSHTSEKQSFLKTQTRPFGRITKRARARHTVQAPGRISGILQGTRERGRTAGRRKRETHEVKDPRLENTLRKGRTSTNDTNLNPKEKSPSQCDRPYTELGGGERREACATVVRS